MDPGHGYQAAGRLDWLGALSSSQLLSPHPPSSPLPALLFLYFSSAPHPLSPSTSAFAGLSMHLPRRPLSK